MRDLEAEEITQAVQLAIILSERRFPKGTKLKGGDKRGTEVHEPGQMPYIIAPIGSGLPIRD